MPDPRLERVFLGPLFVVAASSVIADGATDRARRLAKVQSKADLMKTAEQPDQYQNWDRDTEQPQ
jgi:hypothetical protein